MTISVVYVEFLYLLWFLRKLLNTFEFYRYYANKICTKHWSTLTIQRILYNNKNHTRSRTSLPYIGYWIQPSSFSGSHSMAHRNGIFVGNEQYKEMPYTEKEGLPMKCQLRIRNKINPKLSDGQNIPVRSWNKS